jgi:tripartite motif-containing protein 71
VLTPRAIAIDPSDNVFVADQNDRVQKFNSSGVFQLSWGTAGSGNGQFLNGAGGVAVDSAGNVYVTDLGNHRIEKFTSGGSFIMS